MLIKHFNDEIVVLIVYVNDIVVTGSDSEEIYNLKRFLAKEFEIKDFKKV